MKMVIVIIFGSMGLVLVVHVLKSITTEVYNTAVEAQIVKWVVNVTGLWKYGIMYLHNSIVMVMAIILNYNRKILIQVWD